MKIGIDARFLTHPQKGGFKTYTVNLISALAQVDLENEYILYLDRPPDPDTDLPDKPNFSYRIVSRLIPMVGMSWREQVDLPSQIKQDGLDLFHSPCLSAPLRLTCPLVVTIHDILWLFPERFSRVKPRSPKRQLMEWYYRYVPQIAARRASAIITVSQAAKESLVKHLNLSESRIIVTYEAANEIFKKTCDEQKIRAFREKNGLDYEFILAIGSADPRKNIDTLIKADALLPADLRESYKLIIVLTSDLLAAGLTAGVDKLGLSGHVHFLKHVSDADLVLLYSLASLFVFPSLYEGFGLPPLEAMACGVPVVAANNSSVPEVVGNAAILIDAEDAGAIAEAIFNVLVDESLQNALIRKGLKRSSTFSWTKCASQTLEAYRVAAGQRI